MAIQSIGNLFPRTPLVTDPRDLNRDGKVTLGEVLAYDRARRTRAAGQAGQDLFAPLPKAETGPKGIGGLFDRYA